MKSNDWIIDRATDLRKCGLSHNEALNQAREEMRHRTLKNNPYVYLEGSLLFSQSRYDTACLLRMCRLHDCKILKMPMQKGLSGFRYFCFGVK